MREKLTVQKFVAVRRALAAGMRHVEIARELDLSVWTIQKVHDDPDMQMDLVTEEQLPVDDAPPDYAAADLRRCAGCGAMVYHWPCIACAVANSPRVPPAEEVVDELVDRIGWDEVEVARSGRGRKSKVENRKPEKGSGEWAPWGRPKRRTKRDNVGYRAKLAAASRIPASEVVSAG